MLKGKNLYRIVVIAWATCFVAIAQSYAFARQPVDEAALNRVMVLDKHIHGATFVFVNAAFAREVKHNKVILLKPIGDNLRINFDEYVHKGHNGPLYIILPENYAGPKEKFILKSFPDYHGWRGSMLTGNYVMYAAK